MPLASLAFTVTGNISPAFTVEGATISKRVAAPGVICIVSLPDVSPDSAAVIVQVSVPGVGVGRVVEREPRPFVNVTDPSAVLAGSVDVTVTWLLNPVANMPMSSTALIVTLNGSPAVAVAGASTLSLVAVAKTI